MKRDFLISTDFEGIRNQIPDPKRKVKIMAMQLLNVTVLVLSVIGLIANQKSSLHFYTINPYYGYGTIGRFMHGVVACGIVGNTSHAMVILMNEGRGNLPLITDLKRMYEKLTNRTLREKESFFYHLKIILHIRVLVFTAVSVPIILFRGIGAFITARQFQSVNFFILYLPTSIFFIIVMQYCTQTYMYVHLLIAQSTTYFQLRLARVQQALLSVLCVTGGQACLEPQVKQRMEPVINTALSDLKDTLVEIMQHNQCIKHWLREELISIAGMFVMGLAFTLGNVEWYFRVFPAIAITFLILAVGVSFSRAAQLFVRIQSIAIQLHSCQRLLRHETPSRLRHRTSGLLPPQISSRRHTLKTKYQVLRMIHRLSSPHPTIGYTNGNGESFSPARARQFVEFVLCHSLMFLNAKDSAIADILTH